MESPTRRGTPTLIGTKSAVPTAKNLEKELRHLRRSIAAATIAAHAGAYDTSDKRRSVPQAVRGRRACRFYDALEAVAGCRNPDIGSGLVS